MEAPRSPDGTWSEYFEAALRKPLHPLYAELDRHLPPQGHALELGCGVGHGVLHLLQKGLRVTAIDISLEALAILRTRLPKDADVELVLSSLEDADLPPCDLAVAGFALFFLAPDDLTVFWQKLTSVLRPGGLFMGEFLGVNDDWAREGYTAHSRIEVEALLAAFEPLHLEDVERDGFTVRGTPKHWHAFHVIARKKA
jgi:tellurite methyltransferase